MRHRTLIALTSFIAFWSLFYAGFKYFFWGYFESMDPAPTLEGMSGLVLLGSMIAYVVGGPLYARLGERRVLILSLWLALIFFLIALGFSLRIPSVFTLCLVGLGFSYSLYVIGKNTLIGREMQDSALPPSSIGAVTTIIFIVMLVLGTVIGSKIGETPWLWQGGIIYFCILLGVAFFLLHSTRAESRVGIFHFSFATYRRLFVRYGLFMVALGCFWQISVEASQVAIGFSKEVFGKSNAESSLLLLFSSVGAIVGNIVSMRVAKYKTRGFLVLTTLFLLVTISFSSVLMLADRLESYLLVQILATLLGAFFWASVNLAESHFFSLLGEDPEKEYASALYGFVLSVVGVIMMFSAEKILATGSYFGYTLSPYHGITIFLWWLGLIALIGGYRGIQIEKVEHL